MSITAFSESRALEPDELAAAPVRYPRPSVLTARLRFDHAKAEKAAAGLGLVTVGDLLEHLPRDRREARSVAQLVAGETATVVVEVRSIASRPVRRRGMRPLVEATVADGHESQLVGPLPRPGVVEAQRPREHRGARVAQRGPGQLVIVQGAWIGKGGHPHGRRRHP